MFGPIICTNQPSAIAVRTSSDTTTHHECCRALQCVLLCVLLCVLHFIWTSIHKKIHQNIDMTSKYWICRPNTKDKTRMSIWCLYRSRDRHGCRLGICVWTSMYTSVQQKINLTTQYWGQHVYSYLMPIQMKRQTRFSIHLNLLYMNAHKQKCNSIYAHVCMQMEMHHGCRLEFKNSDWESLIQRGWGIRNEKLEGRGVFGNSG